MSVRCIFFGKYTPESIKGIIGGSDRMADVEAIVAAAGGSGNLVNFTRGPYDFVADMNLPRAVVMMGAMATVQASGLMSETMYLEWV